MTSITYQTLEENKLRMVVEGRLDPETTAPLWKKNLNKLAQIKPRKIL